MEKLSARTEEYDETDTMLAVYRSKYIHWFKAVRLCYLEQKNFVHKTLHNRENGIIIVRVRCFGSRNQNIRR